MKKQIILLLQLVAITSITIVNSCKKDDSETCTPDDIIVRLQVGGGEMISSDSAIVQAGDSVVFSPGPEKTGTWAWTGPGGFTSSDREITIRDIQEAGDYIASFTNECGETTTATFTISLCTPDELNAWFKVDDNSWWNHTDITVQEGSQINFGPGPATGTWSWSGPNGFTETNRDIVVANFTSDMAGDYIATQTNESGCQSYITFHVTVTSDCVAPIGDYNWTTDGWATVYPILVAVVPEGTALELGPGPGGDNYSWQWTGPTGHDLGTIRDFTIPDAELMTGKYVGVFTNLCGASTADTFRIYVNDSDCPTEAPAEVDAHYDFGDGSWPEGTDVSIKIGQTLTMGPGPNKGTWSWSGPNGYLNNVREVTLPAFTDEMAGAYTAVYTDDNGCSYAQTFKVSVTYTLGDK